MYGIARLLQTSRRAIPLKITDFAELLSDYIA